MLRSRPIGRRMAEIHSHPANSVIAIAGGGIYLLVVRATSQTVFRSPGLIGMPT